MEILLIAMLFFCTAGSCALDKYNNAQVKAACMAHHEVKECERLP
jgi:hypothetical protein